MSETACMAQGMESMLAPKHVSYTHWYKRLYDQIIIAQETPVLRKLVKQTRN